MESPALPEFQVQLTEKAARVIREAFAAEKVDPAAAYVRVGAQPGGCSGYKYAMDFADSAAVKATDRVFTSQGIQLLVDQTCLTDVLGSVEIDYQDVNIVQQGFKFRPLGQGAQCGCGESFEPVKKRA